MKSISVVIFVGVLGVCTGITCYKCDYGSTGCSDPFNSGGSGVSQSSDDGNGNSHTVCIKEAVTGSAVSRSGGTDCTATTFVSGIGRACCYTNLCNAGYSSYHISMIPLFVSVSMIFVKIRRV